MTKIYSKFNIYLICHILRFLFHFFSIFILVIQILHTILHFFCWKYTDLPTNLHTCDVYLSFLVSGALLLHISVIQEEMSSVLYSVSSAE